MTTARLAGFDVRWLEAVTSTNDVARELAENGHEVGVLVVAERQTAGRGRQGRRWESPAGNLYASLLLRPARSMANVASLSLVVALVLAETVETLAAGYLRPQVKWPNDVLADGAKLAGILLEGSASSQGLCQWLIVGIGANVCWSPQERVGYPTTDLHTCGLKDVQPGDLLAALAAPLREALSQWELDGFAPMRQRWLARAAGLHEPIELRLGHRIERGTFEGVDHEGAVLVRSTTGEVRRFTAGELVLG